MKQIKRRQLSEVGTFKCIGGLCSDTCCKGWHVEMDEVAYKCLKGLKGSPLQPLFDSVVIKNSQIGLNQPYAMILMNERHECPFLNQDQWCDLQLIHGESALSKVCASYPRVYNLIDDCLEETLSCSCPEAVKIMMFSESPVHWTLAEGLKHKPIINMKFRPNDAAYSNHVAKHYYRLRQTTVSIIQRSEGRLRDRLTIVGLLMKAIQEVSEKHRLNEVIAICQFYQRSELLNWVKPLLQSESQMDVVLKSWLPRMIEHLPTDIDLSVEMTTVLNSMKVWIKNLDNVVQMESFLYEMNLIENRYEKPLENYLVDMVYKNLFPFTESEYPLEVFQLLMLRYLFIVSGITAVSMERGGVTDQTLIICVQQFSKMTEHTSDYFNLLLDELKVEPLFDILLG